MAALNNYPEMLSPGVYIQEVDNSEYSSDVSSSIVGIVGEAKRGPVNTPTLVTSQKELISMFGEPTEGQYGIYSALEVLSQASQVYYVRICRSATKATAGDPEEDAVTYESAGKGTSMNGIQIHQKLTSEPVYQNLKVPMSYVNGTTTVKSLMLQHGMFPAIYESGEVVAAFVQQETCALFEGATKCYVFCVFASSATFPEEDVTSNVTASDYEGVSKFWHIPNDKRHVFFLVKDKNTTVSFSVKGDADGKKTFYELSFENSIFLNTGVKAYDGEYPEKTYNEIQIKDSHGIPLETFDHISLDSGDDGYVTDVLLDSDYARASSVNPDKGFKAKVLTLSGAQGSGSYATAGDPKSDKLSFTSKNYDSTLNGGSVTITEPDVYGFFNIIIRDANGNELESWYTLSIEEGDDRFVEFVVNNSSERITCTVNPDAAGDLEGDTFKFRGGDDGIEGLSADDYKGDVDGTGVHALDNEELLAIDIMMVPGITDPFVIQEALNVCETRGDCMLVADTPFGMSAQEVTDWVNGDGSHVDHAPFNSSYGAFYWPWLRISDQYTKKNLWMPPSGFVVARYAYTDRVSNPWNAPAGLMRGRITTAIGIEKSPTKAERDLLYGNRNIVNPIANFQSDGLVIWGQKTMQRKPTALDRVNVRRLVCYIRRQVGDAARKYLFENNNSATWTELKSIINPIMSGIKNSGGVYDYQIQMSPTAQDIDNNRMPLAIFFKPTKTAEFIPITFNLMSYAAVFDEGSES